MKSLLVLLFILLANSYAVTLFGFQMGTRSDGTIDTTLYIPPLKSTEPAKLHFKGGRLMSIFIDIPFSSFPDGFEILKSYFSVIFGDTFVNLTEEGSTEMHFMWLVDDVTIELRADSKSDATSIHIMADALARMEMLRDIKSLMEEKE